MTRTYPEGYRLWLLTLALGMGTFIQVLDTSIANVAIPTIAGSLGASADEGTWVITSFAVANGVVLPLTGWLAKRYTEVRLFIASTALFSFVSWLCALSWSLSSLIVLRVIQGAVGGVLIPLSQGLLLQHYPPEKKGMALGFWTMIVVVAPILGPILGGWITDNFFWGWIFYINVPIGLLSAFLTWLVLRGTEGKGEPARVDVVGFLLVLVAVGALQVMLDRGNDLDWFGSSFIVSLAIVSAIGFCLLIPWSLLSNEPVVDLSFFRYRNFLVGTIIISIGFFIFFGAVVLLPLWLQTQMSYTPYWAGLAVAPIGIMPLFFSVLVGNYVNRVDTRWMSTVSFIIIAMTFFWFSTFNTQISFYDLFWPRLIQGIGNTLFFIPLVTITLSQIPDRQLTSASGLFNFIRLIAGGGFGTSIFVSLWIRWSQWHHSRLAESVLLGSQSTQDYLQGFANLGITGNAAYQALDQTVTNQAYMLATNDIFWLAGWGFLLLIPLAWMTQLDRA